MEQMFNTEIMKPFVGRMVSWLAWVSDETHPDRPIELEEYYLKEIKETSGRVFLILEETTRRAKCEDCPLLANFKQKKMDEVIEIVIVPLERVREIKFYQEGV